jgi:hypothetical protein
MLVVLGLWTAATALATAVSFAGVSLVTSSVIRPGVPSVNVEEAAAPAALPASTTTIPPPTTTVTAAAGNSVAPTPTTTVARADRSVAATTAAAPPSTFSVRGGVVTVGCSGATIRLASASPNDGYRLDVRENGPARVDVGFVGHDDDSSITLVCTNGTPVRVGGDDRGGDRPPPTSGGPGGPGRDGGDRRGPGGGGGGR